MQKKLKHKFNPQAMHKISEESSQIQTTCCNKAPNTYKHISTQDTYSWLMTTLFIQIYQAIG